jgi:acid phosphatase type 7
MLHFTSKLLVIAITTISFFINARSASAEFVVITPNLQNITQTGVEIRWTTDRDSAGTFQYHEKNSPSLTLLKQSPGTLHVVKLAGLKPGTEYCYDIFAGSMKFSGIFRTAPPSERDFSFTVWGDNGSNSAVHRQVLSGMMKRSPDFAVSVGDITGSGRALRFYYSDFFKPGPGFFLSVPFFAAVGNHEYQDDPKLAYYKCVIKQPGNSLYYAFTYGSARFIILNSNDPLLRTGAGEQYSWLKSELASSEFRAARFTFMFFHHAPYSRDWYGGEKDIRERIVPLAVESKIDIIFSGHFHSYEHGEQTAGGHTLHYVVTGGGGSPFTEAKNYPPGNNEWQHMNIHEWRHHYILVEMKGNSARVSAWDIDNKEIHSFVINK